MYGDARSLWKSVSKLFCVVCVFFVPDIAYRFSVKSVHSFTHDTRAHGPLTLRKADIPCRGVGGHLASSSDVCAVARCSHSAGVCGRWVFAVAGCLRSLGFATIGCWAYGGTSGGPDRN